MRARSSRLQPFLSSLTLAVVAGVLVALLLQISG
jgi:hypothetical protein